MNFNFYLLSNFKSSSSIFNILKNPGFYLLLQLLFVIEQVPN